jgi:CheY-like chemotaxis protein
MDPKPTIRLAETGAEAVALFQADRADAVLLDSEMPVLDGRQAAVAIRHFERTKPSQTPCYMVGLTGHDDPDTHRSLTDAGVDRIFTKPVRPSTLVRLLAQLQEFHAQKPR